jgi:hypothetical protein
MTRGHSAATPTETTLFSNQFVTSLRGVPTDVQGVLREQTTQGLAPQGDRAEWVGGGGEAGPAWL